MPGFRHPCQNDGISQDVGRNKTARRQPGRVFPAIGVPETPVLRLTRGLAYSGLRRDMYNDESWSLGTGILIVMFLLWLSGCTLMQPQQVADKPESMPIAQPLGPARRIVQQIDAIWTDRQASMLAVLELDARHIAMAGLSNDGLSLFNLTYDGNTVVSDKSPLLPEPVNPEFIISDLQLVYWPIAELQKKLPFDWRLEVAGNKRILTVGNKKQAEVNYLSPDPVWPKTVELVNFQYNYRLNIKTISYDLIPE